MPDRIKQPGRRQRGGFAVRAAVAFIIVAALVAITGGRLWADDQAKPAADPFAATTGDNAISALVPSASSAASANPGGPPQQINLLSGSADAADSGNSIGSPGAVQQPYFDPTATATGSGPSVLNQNSQNPAGAAPMDPNGHGTAGSATTAPESLPPPNGQTPATAESQATGPKNGRWSLLQWPHEFLHEHGFDEPLEGEAWCNRPLDFGIFTGAMRGTEMIPGRLTQNTGFLAGVRAGWDFSPYWGMEGRLGFASMQTEWEYSPYLETAEKLTVWDDSLLWYPWGESRFRPYLTLGFGLTEFNFTDDLGEVRKRGLLVMPFGFGWKYRISSAFAMRMDVVDNLAFGSSNLETMNNFSFTTGLEYHFGGLHKSYWPWNPAGW